MTALHRADSLHSRLVRDRDRCCQAPEFDYGAARALVCWGQSECAHIIPRTYRHTRWLLSNAVTLCSRHHGWFTEHPEAWDRWVRARFGDDVIDALWLLARSCATKPAAAEVELKRLRQLATQQGVR